MNKLVDGLAIAGLIILAFVSIYELLVFIENTLCQISFRPIP